MRHSPGGRLSCINHSRQRFPCWLRNTSKTPYGNQSALRSARQRTSRHSQLPFMSSARRPTRCTKRRSLRQHSASSSTNTGALLHAHASGHSSASSKPAHSSESVTFSARALRDARRLHCHRTAFTVALLNQFHHAFELGIDRFTVIH